VKRDKVVHPRTVPKNGTVIDSGRRTATDAIRAARKRAGLTQEKAAERLTQQKAKRRSVAASTISYWESGRMPQSWSELERYAKALGQPIVLRFGPDATKEPPPEWAGAMERRIVSEVQANRETITEALAAAFAEWADRTDRAQREGNADATLDGTEDQPPGGAAPKPGPAT
jgi:transcriptional regulator with XRE-family HTH domain